MSFSLQSSLRLVGIILAAIAFQLTTLASAQENREIAIQHVRLGGEEGSRQKGEEKDDVQPAKRSYWIGIAMTTDDMTITGVYPESPALKAGLKQGDRLLSVGEKELQGPQNLSDLIERSKGESLNVTILRDGKELVVKVTPAKWPTADRLRALLNKMREESKEKK